ncbi:hypothetical protein [Pyxidicoccus trucidator]|uniref:hypothetical protein n=1 Tax=Pyxidicoccus trucidator TaxID=2709662 RepID=UPI0013D948C9|nr:hypothetical protein [Pyxidicoccus trucidator]
MRWVLGVVGALLALAVDVMALPFMLWSGDNPLFKFFFYAPWAIGVSVLTQLKHNGAPVPSGSIGTLSTDVNMALLFLNWFLYAALGFFLGWMMGTKRRAARQQAAGSP